MPAALSCSTILLTRKLRFLSVLFGILTFLLHLLWESVEWTVYMNSQNITLANDNFLAPLPITYYAYQGILLWTLFSSIPFILSQQFFVCLILLAILVHDVIKALQREVHSEAIFYEKLLSNKSSKNIVHYNKLLLLTAKRAKSWTVSYHGLMLICDKINRYFGWIMLVLYGMDFLNMLGFLSNIVNNAENAASSYVYLIFSSLMFLSFLTLFFFPMVAVYETVSEFARQLGKFPSKQLSCCEGMIKYDCISYVNFGSITESPLTIYAASIGIFHGTLFAPERAGNAQYGSIGTSTDEFKETF